MPAVILRQFGLCRLLLLLNLIAVVGISPATAQETDTSSPSDVLESDVLEDPDAAPAENPDNLNTLRPLANEGSLLSLQGGKRLMDEAEAAINAENYDLAVTKLKDARQVFNQLSNFHLQLASSFEGIDTRITESQRRLALSAGQSRDQATFQLALVHRANNQPELSVPLLIQVIRSQNPTSPLGKKSYQQLFELGFVETPQSGEAQ